MGEEDGLRGELEETIARLVAAELRKVDGISRMLAHFESQTCLAALEIKRLQGRKKSFEASTERLEHCVVLAMENVGKTKLEGETSTLKLRANPPSVIILDETAIPEAYKTLVPATWAINKAPIAKALKGGLDVPGADLSEGNMRLVRS
jgi:hypothetical protein